MTYPYCGTFRISIQSMLSDKDSDKSENKTPVKKKACEMRRNQKKNRFQKNNSPLYAIFAESA